MTKKRTPVPLIRSLVIIDRGRKRHKSRTGFSLILRIVGLLVLIAILTVGVVIGMGVGSAAAAYNAITANLPTPDDVARASVQTFETTKIYDRTGKNLLYEVIDPNAGDRNWVSLSQVPDYVVCGTVAAEDKTFWTNPGFNTRGLLRAFYSNLQGEDIQGGSSITQQVVKNSVIPIEERYEKSYTRKIKEILIAMELTRLYSKEEILEWYINTNLYANLAYGIDAAARVYFGKSVGELTLSEAATLIAIPQYPLLNPFDAPKEALERKIIILQRMVEEGCITSTEAKLAEAESWKLAQSNKRFDIQAPHFSMYVRRQLESMFSPELVAGGGLRVYTTLDLNLNNQSQCTVQTYLRILKGEDPAVVIPEAVAAGCEAAQYIPDVPASRVGKDFNIKNSAVVIIRPTTGEILAMVGSADYWNDEIDGKFNVAADGLRQPGSSFKPFTYVTFLAQGHNAAYMFLDVRQAFDQGAGMAPYVPENYTRTYNGPVSMRSALARSLNIPAVEAMSIAGIDNVLRTAHRMGITTLDKSLQHYGLSLTLGGGEVKLIDMTYAFTVFANNGLMFGQPVPTAEQRPNFRELNPVAILRVEDRNGKVLYEYSQPESRQVLDPRLAYLMTNILSDRQARIPTFGTPNALELANQRPAGGKTGTTNNFTDNWAVGFTPQIAIGVWQGNKDAEDFMINTDGIRGAAYIWHAMMEYALKDEPIVPFTRPEGLIEVTVCSVSGLKPNGHCPTRTEIMIPGTEPTETDNIHQVFLVNRETGKLATIYTPPELVEERVYMVLPPEAQDWINSLPEEKRVDIPPTEYDTIYGPNQAQAEVAVISPTAYSYVRGVVPITGNARGGNFAFFRLVFGKGLNPTEWRQIGPDHGNQVDNNILEFFDTTGLEDGLYTLQLQVVGQDQGVRQATMQFTVDNTPPKVDLTYPVEGSEYTYGVDEWVNINAEVNDNYAVARVDFFKGDETEPFKFRTIAPFNVNWTLGGPGEYQFRVVVYDAAGNKTETEPVKIRVVPKK
ncbi:MAG TPA: transglycosylase domain-containing protein [Anaerolineae bacterium]|nr:transglycosylase domain-containing protein [Anaerolineae bacterium]HQI82977.1 transglycosylase domain-containing protein [Anaerolineae bacterium]